MRKLKANLVRKTLWYDSQQSTKLSVQEYEPNLSANEMKMREQQPVRQREWECENIPTKVK